MCEKLLLTHTQVYQWQKIFFEHGEAAFAKTANHRASSQAEQQITKLEDKLKRKTATPNWKPPASGGGKNARRKRNRSSPEMPLAAEGENAQKPFVRSEDRALLGSNPSAATDSKTAGLDGFGRPGRPPAGSKPKRKNHR